MKCTGTGQGLPMFSINHQGKFFLFYLSLSWGPGGGVVQICSLDFQSSFISTKTGLQAIEKKL